MRPTVTAAALALAVTLALPAAAAAADREHEQLMADIRMLQEHALRLHLMMNAFDARLNSLAEGQEVLGDALRRAFADQQLATENIATVVRVVRERVDESNVRIASLSQEFEALRQAIPRMPLPTTVLTVDPETGLPITSPGAGEPETETAATAGADPAVPLAAVAPGAGISPQRLYDTAWADYTNGQWALAIQGFEAYIKTVPRSDFADDAAFYIGQTYFAESRFDEAVDAFEQVLLNYPDGDVVPEASYKRGLALERLDDPERARQAFELVVTNYPESDMAALAQQALDRLGQPQP
jgi:tol-pal system protein YbgF